MRTIRSTPNTVDSTRATSNKNPNLTAGVFWNRTGKNNERITGSYPYKYKKSAEDFHFSGVFCIFAAY